MSGLDSRKGLGHDAQAVLSSLFRHPGDGGLIELRIIRRGDHVLQEFVPAHDGPRAARRAIELRDQGDVYYGVGLRTHEAGGKAAVASLPAIWADIDSGEAIAELVTFALPPTLVINTGTPGHVHAYWFTTEPLEPDVGEGLNRRIAATLGADVQAVHASQVLRLPGTLNHKQEPPAEVTLADFTAKYYSAAEISAILPDIAVPMPPARDGDGAPRVPKEPEDHGSTARVLALLDAVSPSGDGWRARCPAHDDEHPSLSIAEGEDGRCLLHCHAGCSVPSIVAALGLELTDLFPDGVRGRRAASRLVHRAEHVGIDLFHTPSGVAHAAIKVERSPRDLAAPLLRVRRLAPQAPLRGGRGGAGRGGRWPRR